MTATHADRTRTELVELLGYLCADAKELARRGRMGTDSAKYRLVHEDIDEVLGQLVGR